MSNQHIGRYKRRPDGGHGGDGGAVILVASPNEQTLGMSVHHYSGEDGKPGGSRGMNGRCGKNKIVRVPCGVLVRRVLDYDEVWDEKEKVVRSIGEDDEHNGDVLLSNSDVDDQDVDAEEEGHQYKPQTIHVGSEGENYFTDDEDGSDQEGYDEIEGSDIGSNDDEDFDEIEYDDNEDFNEIEYDDEEEEEEDRESELDIEDVVNTGIKASDGMYHWRPEQMPNDGTEEEWVSSTSDIFNYEREKILIADLDKPGSCVVLATGGRGGTGSSAYAKKQWNPGLMANASERRVGRPGETAHLELELKLIADLGLVGFPNAGKSSLLSSMSEAKPEIAPYPFTTLHPLVGTIRYRDGFRVIAADVPGLIDGASEGRGRGHDFLRHLERTKALLYIVDAAGVDGRNPIDDLYVLADEISSYGDGDMMNRPALLVANKMDLIAGETQRESLLFDLAVAAEDVGIDHHGDVLGISAGVTGEGLSLLSKSIRTVVTEGEANRLISEAAS